MTISGNPPSFQYDEPRSTNPEAIKAVREALKQQCGGGTEYHGDGAISISYRFPSHLEAKAFREALAALAALAPLAAEQAKAPPDRERLARSLEERALYVEGERPDMDIVVRDMRDAAAALRLSPVTAGEWQPSKEAIEDARKTLDVYERVHEELDEGKNFEDIDSGLNGKEPPWTYNSWVAYMRQRLINQLRQIILVTPIPPSPKEAGR